MKMKNRIVFFLLCAVCSGAYAQQEAPNVRRGNRAYKAENYTEAELDYRRGLEKNESSFEAQYNLGNALFRQQNYPEAAKHFATASALLQNGAQRINDVPQKNRERLSQAYHNLGNALYAQQEYGEAVKAFQNSLRLNPKDNDTRYNLVKAQQQQQLQQQQQDQNNQDQQQQQQQEQNNQDQQEQQQEKQQEQQQQQQPQNQMDRETAEQILQALEQDEQETKDKVKPVQGRKRHVEKDW